VLLVAGTLLCSAFASQAVAQLPVKPTASDRHAVIRFINKERKAQGLRILVEDKRLTVAAQSQAAWALQDGKSGHHQGAAPSSGASYEEFLRNWGQSDWHAITRIARAGYVPLDAMYKPIIDEGRPAIAAIDNIHDLLGENVAYGSPASPIERFSPERIVTMWMGSPGHRKAILGARFAEIGVGYAVTQGVKSRKDQAAAWCAVFATPELRGK